ncbi:MAG: hypothetical protein H7A41_07685 [Chlamydiales bacterium]|nr:hypothetical protein [Chlamydiales bacterium]
MASFMHSISSRFRHTHTPAANLYNPTELPEFTKGTVGLIMEENGAPDTPYRNWSILFVGGILNTEDDVFTNAERLKEMTDKAVIPFWNNVHATHKQDRQRMEDVIEQLSPIIEELVQRGKLCIIAHSHGALLVSNTLQSLKDRDILDETRKANLEVYTYGGVTTVAKDLAGVVLNYRNHDDTTQVIGTIKWHKKNDTQWISLQGPGSGHQLIGGYDTHAAQTIRDFTFRSENTLS